MAKRKYTPEYIKLLQKRTTDKMYGLRKRGGTPAQVNRVSPRRPMAEVRGLSPREMAAYGKKLERFNSRATALTPLASGEIVSTKRVLADKRRIRQFQDEMAKIEKTRQERFQANKLLDIYKYSHERQARERGAMALTGEYNPPASKQRLKVREEKAQIAKRQRAKTTAAYRRSVVSRLEMMGEDVLAAKVRNMRADRFDILDKSTDLNEALALYYSPENNGVAQEQIYDPEGSNRLAEAVFRADAFGRGGDPQAYVNRQYARINKLSRNTYTPQNYGQ